MKRLIKESMANHTTFRIGGPANISIPENREELLNEIKRCLRERISYKILGNGSNILVKDGGLNGIVIKNTLALNYLYAEDDGRVTAGSSVLLPKLVNYCVENNLEGMEYLSSVPGTIGGAVYMNAGRGPGGPCISDKIQAVKVFNGREIIELRKNDLLFSYRRSIFHKRKDWVIIEAMFKLEKQEEAIGKRKIKERMNQIQKTELSKYASAGSIYKKASPIALKLLENLKIGGCKFKSSWILNIDNGSARDILRLLKISRIIHFFCFKKPELEIEIWE